MNEAFLQGSMYLYNIYNGIKARYFGAKVYTNSEHRPEGLVHIVCCVCRKRQSSGGSQSLRETLAGIGV